MIRKGIFCLDNINSLNLVPFNFKKIFVNDFLSTIIIGETIEGIRIKNDWNINK